MGDKIQINKVEITIGGKTLRLSIKELKGLKSALEALFPDPIVVTHPVYIDRPWIDRHPIPYWSVTCDSRNQGTLMMAQAESQH